MTSSGEFYDFELDTDLDIEDAEVAWDEDDLFDLIDDSEDLAQLLGDRKVDYLYDYDPEDFPYGWDVDGL